MAESNVNIAASNEVLKQEFSRRGLDLEAVWHPSPGDPSLENRQLRRLLQWVTAYERCPGRAELRKRGFDYPPVEPDFDPEADWMRFERWMRGEAVEWSFATEFGSLRPADELSEEEIKAELKRVTDLLAAKNVVVALHRDVPARVVYLYLVRELESSTFEYLPRNTHCHLDACSGYCPGCIQRPWCDLGQEEGWPEDEEAGHMVFPEEIKPYVSATAPEASTPWR